MNTIQQKLAARKLTKETENVNVTKTDSSEKPDLSTETIPQNPTGLSTDSIGNGDSNSSSVINPVVDYRALEEEEGAIAWEYEDEVTITLGDLMDIHRMLSYCLRGNQRPAVLKAQQRLVSLLPEGVNVKHREP